MNLTKPELKELEALFNKHPVVKKLFDELRKWEETDPSKTLYIQFAKAAQALGDDLESVANGAEGKLINADKEDKTFDRFIAVISKGEVIFKGLETGKRLAVHEQKEEKATPMNGKKKVQSGRVVLDYGEENGE